MLKTVSIVGVCNSLGYGVANYNIVHALTELGIKVQFFTINTPTQQDLDSIPEKYHTSIIKSIQNTRMPDFDVPAIRIYHQFDMSMFPGKGLHIGFPFFELDTFTEVEQLHMKSLDCIFVASNWAKQIVSKYIDKDKIDVVPLGVDTKIFYKKQLTKPKTTTFINIGKWEHRKNQESVISAFNDAFDYNDDVALWLCCDNPCYPPLNEIFAQKIKQSKLFHKIRIVPRAKTQVELSNLINISTCGVFPSRAEGWNLEILECMAANIPVITTNYSAHTEFCTKENSELIEISGLEPANDGIWFHSQGNWATWTDYEHSQLIDKMRKMHLTNQAGDVYNGKLAETVSKFSWENTAKTIMTTLEGRLN